MTTEKDIRKFIQDNKIRLPKDDGFMEDLLRQIDLLPTPASLSLDCAVGAAGGSHNAGGVSDRDEKSRLISAIGDALKRRNRKIAIEVVITNMIFCGLIVLLVFLVDLFFSETLAMDSGLLNGVMNLRYLICGILCALFVLCYNYRISKDFLGQG